MDLEGFGVDLDFDVEVRDLDSFGDLVVFPLGPAIVLFLGFMRMRNSKRPICYVRLMPHSSVRLVQDMKSGYEA